MSCKFSQISMLALYEIVSFKLLEVMLTLDDTNAKNKQFGSDLSSCARQILR